MSVVVAGVGQFQPITSTNITAMVSSAAEMAVRKAGISLDGISHCKVVGPLPMRFPTVGPLAHLTSRDYYSNAPQALLDIRHSLLEADDNQCYGLVVESGFHPDDGLSPTTVFAFFKRTNYETSAGILDGDFGPVPAPDLETILEIVLEKINASKKDDERVCKDSIGCILVENHDPRNLVSYENTPCLTALHEAIETGRVQKGDLVFLLALDPLFWAATVLRL